MSERHFRHIGTPTPEQFVAIESRIAQPMPCLYCARVVPPGAGVHGVMQPEDPSLNRLLGGTDFKIRVVSWRVCLACWYAIEQDASEEARMLRIQNRIIDLAEAAHRRARGATRS